MKNRLKWGTLAASTVVAASVMLAGPAMASTSGAATAVGTSGNQTAASGQLDPATFSGPLLVATPLGDVPVTVRAGEAPSVISQVQKQAKNGTLKRSRIVSPTAVDCGKWVNAVATPFSYSTSVRGCAVAGYHGYKRQYTWSNQSDVELCSKGLGWANDGTTKKWYSTGCTSGSYMVPWGNSLAYTQMQGQSLSGVTGAAYRFKA